MGLTAGLYLLCGKGASGEKEREGVREGGVPRALDPGEKELFRERE